MARSCLWLTLMLVFMLFEVNAHAHENVDETRRSVSKTLATLFRDEKCAWANITECHDIDTISQQALYTELDAAIADVSMQRQYVHKIEEHSLHIASQLNVSHAHRAIERLGDALSVARREIHACKEKLAWQVRRQDRLSARIHSAVANRSWSATIDGRNWCGPFRVTIAKDIVVDNNLRPCIEWCQESSLDKVRAQFRCHFLMDAWSFGTIPEDKRSVSIRLSIFFLCLCVILGGCGCAAGHILGVPILVIVVVLVVGVPILVIVVGLELVGACGYAFTLYTSLLWVVIKTPVCLIFDIVLFLCQVLVLLVLSPMMFLHGHATGEPEPVELCRKVEASSFASMLPEYAGPCFGVLVIGTGVALYILKVRCFTHEEFLEVDELRDQLKGLSRNRRNDHGIACAWCAVIVAPSNRKTASQQLVIEPRGVFGAIYAAFTSYHVIRTVATRAELTYAPPAPPLAPRKDSHDSEIERFLATKPTLHDEKWRSKYNGCVQQYHDNLNKTLKDDNKYPGYRLQEVQLTYMEEKEIWQGDFPLQALEELQQTHSQGTLLSGKIRYRKEIRPEVLGRVEAKGGWQQFVSQGIFLLKSSLPAVDNYSDTAQSVTFLRKGEPIYYAYSVVGIFWNVVVGIKRNPPEESGWRFVVEVVGRVFQADVIEASAQCVRAGGVSRFLWEKHCIQTSTETLTTLPIVLLAIMQMGSIKVEGFGADGPTWLRFILDLVLVNGDVGLFTNLFLSAMSLYTGLGEASQYVQAFEALDARSGLEVRGFKPDKTVSMLRVADVMSFLPSLVIARCCTSRIRLYVGAAIVMFALGLLVQDGCCSPMITAFKALLWPVLPQSTIWPWDKPIRGKRCLIWFCFRSASLCVLWAWMLASQRQALSSSLYNATDSSLLGNLLFVVKLGIMTAAFTCSVSLAPLAYHVYSKPLSSYTLLKEEVARSAESLHQQVMEA